MVKHAGFIGILAAFAAVGQAQQGQVAGPVLGYVFDGTARAVRPVLGIPGASIFGSTLPLGYDVTTAWISPAGDSSVAIAADGSLHLVRLTSGQGTEISLNGATGKPERVVFSPSGTSVALIASGRAQVFSGLPGSATLSGTMDLGVASAPRAQAQIARRGTAAAPAGMALSDDGAWLLAVENGSLELIGAGGSHAIATVGRSGLAAFAPGGHDAAMLDSQQVLTMVRSVDSTATQQVLAQNAGVTGAAGLAFSADGKSLFLAGAGQTMMVVNVSTGAQTAVACNCTATGLQRMGNVYRLTEPGSGPVWLLDPAAGTPRVVFIPALGGSE